MRVVVVAIGLLLSGGGCSLVQTAARVGTDRVAQVFNDHAERKRNADWAEEAWVRVQSDTDHPYSDDYGAGFRQGFADFLYRGGDGEPPPLPPQKYRALRNQTTEGYEAVQEWFAGFRHGAREAAASGQRELVTGPSSLRSSTVAPAAPPMPPPTPPAPEPVRAAPPETAPVPQTLPAPRVAPAPDIQATYRSEDRAWHFTAVAPDGRPVEATMGVRPFTAFMQTVRQKKDENLGLEGRHVLAVSGAAGTELLEIDSATYDDVVAALKWYFEAE